MAGVRNPLYQSLRRAGGVAIDAAQRSRWHSRRTIARYLASNHPAKLHIGCGDHVLKGWLNTEYEIRPPLGGIYLDASQPFPIEDGRFDFIFSEHVIEHLDLPAARRMLGECHRVLKTGGRIRIGTPRLDFLAEMMLAPGADHRRYADFHLSELSEPGSPKSVAGIVNDYFHLWGHRFIHDEASLRGLLEGAGFAEIRRVTAGESGVPELRGLENEARMPDGLLALTTMTFEAVKAA